MGQTKQKYIIIGKMPCCCFYILLFVIIIIIFTQPVIHNELLMGNNYFTLNTDSVLNFTPQLIQVEHFTKTTCILILTFFSRFASLSA